MRWIVIYFFILGIFPYGACAEELQPHRAFYTVSMASTPHYGGNVSDVRGTMMIEMNKVCNGWTIQQRSETWLYMNSGENKHIRWGYVVWESKDGKVLRFNTSLKSDGKLIEDIRGVANVSAEQAVVSYELPKQKAIKLPVNTLFPIQHTRALLKAAEESERLFPRIVFDGSRADGALEINAFIGPRKEIKEPDQKKPTKLMVHQPFWPVRFAVYNFEKNNYQPEFTTSQELLSNGIIKEYIIDNDGLKIKGTLVRLELLTSNGC